MTILLTGFNAFGDIAVNPSQLIVEAIQENFMRDNRDDLITDILPTEYETAGKRITELILQHTPDWVVGLGVAENSTYIRLERVALNVDDASMPDNRGEIRMGQPIALNGPVAYFSTLPLETIYSALKNRNIPARISNHAGTYVCNHMFYTARHEIERMDLRTKCGFIHVPLVGEVSESGMSRSRALPLGLIIKGIECCLDLFRN